MQKAHLITGGTGFVGSALIVELLAKTSDIVVGIVRPQPGVSPQDRLREVVRTAVHAYQAPAALLDAIDTRCFAIAGDSTAEDCGVALADLPDVAFDQFWHSAASLRFEDRYKDEIYTINTQGTENALALAARLGVRHFNYFSTAYVAGSKKGLIREVLLPGEQLNNHYESSKAQAENLVAGEQRFGVRVLRPSIVIGHSQTCAAINFTGMYGFLRKLYGFQGIMARTQAGMMEQRSLQLVGEADTPCDLIPVDLVVENALRIVQATDPVPGEPQFFHLNNPTPPSIGSVVGLMFSLLGMQAPTWVSGDEPLEWLDKKFNSQLDFYSSYMRGNKIFDRSRTDSLVGEESPKSYHLGPERLGDYLRWYLDQLAEERAQLPSSR